MAIADPKTQHNPPAVEQLAQNSPAYGAILETQRLVVDRLVDQLSLQPAQDLLAADIDGTFQVSSESGDAGARVRALRGEGVRWVAASTLAANSVQLGGSITYGFSEYDIPHYLLEETMFDGKVLLCLALWQRRDWVTNTEYTQKYYGTAPPGCQRSYNDVYNGVLQHRGWQGYQSPELVVKPMLSSAMAYTFEPTEENLKLAQEAILEVASLWAGFVRQARQQQDGHPAQEDPEVRAYDARYVQSVIEDPGHKMAARMFGGKAVEQLVSMMHGVPDAAPAIVSKDAA